ncbi:MAG: ankyrin repeat domain-containing protein [Flavobacteriaceae bacterium]|nr:ankyrin repeat domain-containing protein [Flavobacteriaceae bacterium]
MITALFLVSILSVNASTLPSVVLKKTSNLEVVKEKVVLNALCSLVKKGNYEAVKTLLENGASVNAKSGGLTPLMFAARYNKATIATLLIDNGASLKIKSKQGFTALKWAKLSKATDAYKVIKMAMDSK